MTLDGNVNASLNSRWEFSVHVFAPVHHFLCYICCSCDKLESFLWSEVCKFQVQVQMHLINSIVDTRRRPTCLLFLRPLPVAALIPALSEFLHLQYRPSACALCQWQAIKTLQVLPIQTTGTHLFRTLPPVPRSIEAIVQLRILFYIRNERRITPSLWCENKPAHPVFLILASHGSSSSSSSSLSGVSAGGFSGF